MAAQIIGEIALQRSTKLVFSVSEWKGKTFANVRKFIATPTYEGPTKSGMVLSQMFLHEIITTLTNLEKTIPLQKENEFKRIPKTDTEHIRIVTLPSEDEDVLPAVDIREFVDSPTYSGPTKRGVRFRWNLLPDVIACLREQAKVMGEYEKNEPSLFGTDAITESAEEPEEQTHTLRADTLAGVLGEPLKQFPDDFVGGVANICTQMKLPDTPLQLEQDSTGTYVLKTDEGGVFCSVRNPTEAKFILYAQLRGHRELAVPKEMFQIFRTVKAYEKYLRSLRSKVFGRLLKKACQNSVADYETDKFFRTLGLPKLEQ